MKQTNYAFKILYVLGIFFVVAGHCNYGGISVGYDWFIPHSFHLGLFMFISGYFYDAEKEKNALKFICYKFKKLMIPLYVWNLVYGILVLCSKQIGFAMGGGFSLWNLFVAPITDGHQFVYNMSGWYVPSLFFAHVVNVLFRKFIGKFSLNNDWLVEGIYLFVGMAGVYFAMHGYRTGAWLPIVRLAYFLPFYGLGTLYKSKLEGKIRIPGIFYFGIVMTVQLLIITVNKGVTVYYPSWCENFDNVYMPFLAGGCGIFFWLGIAKRLEPVIGKNKYVLLVAEHGYSIMINQFLGFFAVKSLFAFGNKFFHVFGEFSWEQFAHNVWYYYVPRGMNQWLLVYCVAGIVVPVLIGIGLDKLWKKILRKA